MKKRQFIIKIGKTQLPLIQLGQGSPKVLIVAGIHGDETSQLLVLKKLLKKIKLKQGTLSIIPKVNPEGLQKNTEFNPADKININRVFPGSKNSKYISKRIANAVFQKAKENDLVIDLHNFTDPALPQVIFVNHGPLHTRRTALELCKQFNFKHIWQITVKAKSKKNNLTGTLIYQLMKIGIPGLAVEIQPKEFLTNFEIKKAVAGVLNILTVMKMITSKEPAKKLKKYVLFKKENITSSASGRFKPIVKLGQNISSRQTFGQIITNNHKFIIKSSQPGLVTNISREKIMKKNDKLGNIGKIIK